jgi:2-polyprenyl-3-methyl-5-hydroxy-6-metoxy-1,4-benzoquinol methylase
MVIDKVYDLKNLYQSHLIALGWLTAGARVLEFGPATGYMSQAMEQRFGCRVTGYEYSKEAAAQAADHCDQIVQGDIEDFDRWSQLSPPYDILTFLDVLEHLKDPETVLARSWPLLTPDGVLIISVPNVAHWTVRRSLLRGRFDYTNSGIMDNTHLRFFTRRSLYEMLERTGFQVDQIDFTRIDYPLDRSFRRIGLSRVKAALNRLMDKVFPNAVAFQFVVKCRRAPGFRYQEVREPVRLRVSA